MNKTLSIGLAGFSFVIEEHAYIKLSDYLAALRSSLDTNEADEVMHDIEIRIVEIFRDSLGKREVINDDDVEKVIAQIGSPEAIEEQEEAYFSESTNHNYKKQQKTMFSTAGKHLFRDIENGKLGGVCAGLAHYTGMEITWMRIIWVLLFFALIPLPGTPFLLILLYVIFWAVLPSAQSTSDILKMKGKPVNFDTIKEESNKIVQFANESTQKVGEMYQDSKPMINSAGTGAWNVIRYILGIFFAFMSFMFLVGAFFGVGISAKADFPPFNEMNFYFDENNLSYILSTMIVLGSLIPALLFGLLATKLISPKTRLRNIGWVIGGLFLLLIALSTYFGLSMAKREMFLKGYKEDTEEVAINTNSDTLYVDMKQVTIPQNFTGYDDDIYSDKKMVYEKENWPHVEVTRRADVKTPYLIIKKEAKGYNLPINVSVPVEIRDNKLYLPNFVKYPYEHRFRNYRIEYELVLPNTTMVIPGKNTDIDFDGDLDNDGFNDSDDENSNYNNQSGIRFEKNKITINGSTLEYSNEDKDSIIVNGKKVPAQNVKQYFKDSVKIDPSDVDNISIQINKDKKEISIKTDKN